MLRNLRTKSTALVVAGLSALASVPAFAVPDPIVTAGITSAGTAFSDNFGAVAAWFVGITVTLMAFGMLIKYIRRAK